MLRYWDGTRWTGYKSGVGVAAKPDLGSVHAEKVAIFGARQDLEEVQPSRARRASFTYDAFLSYSHQDGAVAGGIQKGLHRIGRRVGRLNALRVFRDSTDLSANPDLWGKVTDAMDRSRYLIVVLSPRAAASEWVDREVGYWLKRRGPDQMLIVLAEGHLHWDEGAGRFDPDRSDVSLPVLKEPGVLPGEPLYVDVSGDAPWDPQASTFRDKVTDLAAPIHGKSKYELASDDVREQRRFRRLRRAAIVSLVVLTVGALVAATYAFVQRQQAIHQRNEAVARQLVSEAQSMLAGVREGNDARAINQVLAARKIAAKPDEGAALSALQATTDQLKIIDTDAVVSEIAISTDGQRIMSAGSGTGSFRTSTVTFRDAGTGRITATFPGFAFSADGSRVLSFVDDKRLQARDTRTGQPVGPAIEQNQDGGALMDLAFSPDTRKVVFAQYPSMLYLWDIESGTVIPMTGFSDAISSVVFMPDGRRVVTSGSDGVIRVWDAESGLQLSQPISMKNSPSSALAVSKDERHIITDGELSNGVRIWDLDTGQLIAHGEAHAPQYSNYVRSLALSRDGRRIVSGSTDRTIQMWDAETAAPIGGPLTGHRDTVDGVAFSVDGEQIISGSSDKTIRVWNANPTNTLGKPVAGAITSDVAISPDGRRIVWYGDAAINVWDAQTLKPVLPPLVGEADDFALSRDGLRIASLGATTVTIWDGNTGARLHEWNTGQQLSPIFARIIFSPDGQKIATFGNAVHNFGKDDQTSDTSLVVWDANSGTQIGPRVAERTTGAGVTSAAFSPDARYLAHNKDMKLTIVDVASGRTVKEPSDVLGLLGVEYAAYRPDGKQILAVGAKRGGSTAARTISLLDPRSGQILAEMTDPTGVAAPIFTANGKYIISGHKNNIRVWDAENHVAIGDLTGGTAHADVIAISDDNRHIVATNLSVDREGQTYVEAGLWPGPTAWADLLCAKLSENMSDKDWNEWVGTAIPYTPACPDLPKSPN
jgi:WD40 repeat protein